YPVRQLQRLGRAGRDLVRLPHAVGEPLPAPVRGTGHAAHAHRQHLARRALLFPILIPRRTSMTEKTTIHDLQVHSALKPFLDDQVLPAVGVAGDKFWQGFDAIVRDLSPKNDALLAE